MISNPVQLSQNDSQSRIKMTEIRSRTYKWHGDSETWDEPQKWRRILLICGNNKCLYNMSRKKNKLESNMAFLK